MTDKEIDTVWKYSRNAPKSICMCNHTGDGGNSQHADIIQLGHGHCNADGCSCRRFQWAGFTLPFTAFMRKGE